ncbi:MULTISPECIES: NAD(P)H oxidoreductase [unclassified Streptomyces]|uniref:NAD(P)H oxidoreductase n=1 Tax=unclassified Streptomyces TaxID=2593676 RepID=UPI0007F53B87|nr:MULTISPECIES: NAD(P)H oxidoreductase [unclassified Streptomyces]MCM1975088.1 NAD(P)H oxidoreductase [Streptomyces sp. G1]SBT93783.1 Putative NADPH-quinone reductase (modulator of drug activity B) [Streptomyces sp. DI166]
MPQHSTKTALVVVAHHRSDSLTAHTARRAAARLRSAGYRIDLLDLHAEGFDPRMTVEDQPDWGNRDKTYSKEVHAHMQRILDADVVVAVFPVYWQSVPAILKGWIDRVWNYGFAYGRSKPRLAGKRMLWLGLAGATADDPVAQGMRSVLEAGLSDGIAAYCGFSHSTVGLLLDAEERPQRVDAEGNLLIGDAAVGAEREAKYADFDRRALRCVDDFLAAEPVAV